MRGHQHPPPRSRPPGGAVGLHKWLMAGLGLVTAALFVAWSRALRDPLGGTGSETARVLAQVRQELASQRRRADAEARERVSDREERSRLQAELKKREEQMTALRSRAEEAEAKGGKEAKHDADGVGDPGGGGGARHSLGEADTVGGMALPSRFEIGKLHGAAAAFGPDAWAAVVAPDRDLPQPDGVQAIEEFERTLWPRLQTSDGRARSPMTGVLPALPERIAKLETWARESGAAFPKLKVDIVDASRSMCGTVATDELRAGEPAVTVPLKMLVHSGMALDTPVGAKCAQEAGLQQELLVVWLLTDVPKESSPFRYFYQVLPQTYDSYALFWDPQQMRQMRGSHFVERRNQLLWNWVEAYERVRRCAGDLAAAWTLPQWLWARTVVMTRNFRISINGTQKALIPVADMFNHQLEPRMVKWAWQKETESFAVTAARAINGSEEIRLSYGDKETKRYLMWYNFVDPRTGERECTGDYAEVQWLEHGAPENERQLHRLSYHNSVDWVARLVTDIRRRLPSVDWLGNEWLLWASALMRAARIAQAKLQSYATELGSDIERANAPDAAGTPRGLAAQGLLSEKRILHHVLRMAEIAVPQLAKWRAPGWRLVDPELLNTTLVSPSLMPRCAAERLTGDLKTLMLRGRGTVVKGGQAHRMRGAVGERADPRAALRGAGRRERT